MCKVDRKYSCVFILVFVPLLLVQESAFAQEDEREALKDSVFLKKGDFLYKNDSFLIMEKDTVIFLKNGEYKVNKDNYQRTRQLYDSLAVIMDKRWITKEAYSLLFSSVARKSISDSLSGHFKAADAFKAYRGMKISSIYLTKVAVLEGSVDDTVLIATSDVGKLANDLHFNTRDWVIRQYLLFRVGDNVDPYVLSDNERIIRSLDFIEDARIVVHKISTDEAEVYIITKDVFSIGIGGKFRGFDEFRFDAFDKNIFGLGNELRVGLIHNNDFDRPFGYATAWSYNNIMGSFVDAYLQYETTSPREHVRQVISRKFLSPEIKYAGELDLGWKRDTSYDFDVDSVYENPYELRYFDLWFGRSFLLNTKDKRTNLIVAGRYAQNNFLLRPEVKADTNVSFHDNDIILGSVSLKRINYFKSHKILGFGIVEDIPYGFIMRLLAGKSYSEYFDRPYYGIQLSGGDYIDEMGYVWLDARMGTFWKEDDGLSELLMNISAVYFTPLYNFANYEGRTIINASYNSGLNNEDDRGLNFYRRVRGFDDRAIHGLGSFTLGIESIFFTPWYFYGFKFAPYAFADVGVISDRGFQLQNLRAYPGFGVGIRIRNESLVFNTISIRIAVVPRQLLGYGHVIFNGSAGQPALFNDGFDDKPYFNTLEVY